MPRPERQQSVLDLLRNLHGLEPLKKLFWSELSYQRVNKSLSRRGWPDAATKGLTEDPVLFASGGQDEDFHVIYARLASEHLRLGDERPVVSRLLKDHPYALFAFSNSAQDRWHFLNVKYDEKAEKRRLFRRITIGPGERLRTASERVALLDLESINQDLYGVSPLTIQQRHDEAFDVESVTKLFFEEYKAIFGILQDDLNRQTKNQSWAHDTALQFLNRCMFIYFLQRKHWIGGDADFLRSFWESYRRDRQDKDSFFERWLKVLFFEAFNNRFRVSHRDFPDEIKHALALAPYLNGGLFLENDLDRKYSFSISDVRFEQVFTFFERYNFTIAEDSPLDQEVAVDPEMIGKVYESLVNVSSEADERGDAGIFYTPRTEIDLMCRLALVDHLANRLGQSHKNLLYESVFALEQEEKVNADRAVTEMNLWRELDACLREITVVDPACGSGSFLVGMLHILDDLQDRAGHQLGQLCSAFDRKKRIIGQSLYGVDIMDWACHVAELRLWLALIIDAEFTSEELHVRNEPLLPHFSFKIRCGDSLVQEVGAVNLGHISGLRSMSHEIKARITRLKNEKLKFYNNDPSCQFHSPDEAIGEELQLFRDILNARYKGIQEEIKALQRKIEGPQERQVRLDGTVEEQSHQVTLEATKWQAQLDALSNELERVNNTRAAIRTARDVPFVWDIAFVEIFEGEKEGFDIVIGNPPYVRQENIADPHLPRADVTNENKKDYRIKLAHSVYQVFPSFFGYKLGAEKLIHTLDAKSDLYVYFYFRGLSLLNSKGSFCFITSNSWLDVGYGKDLKEFLLKHCHVKMVLDNQAKRSFATADVNTVIVFFSWYGDHREWALDQTARFIMFKVPFELILSPIIFQEIETANDRKNTPEYRVYPIRQELLLEEGFELQEDVADAESGELRGVSAERGHFIKVPHYIGNKWGGKYLRAPDIYFTLLDKGVRFNRSLSEYFDGERYLNTGGADGFFIITDVRPGSHGFLRISNSNTTPSNDDVFEGEIEKDYLVPLIKDYTKSDKRIEIHGSDAHCLVVQGRPSSKVQKYIKWGEKQGYHKRSVTINQRPWYKPTRQMLAGAKILVPRSFSDSFVIYYNPKSYLSLRYYRLHQKKGRELSLIAYLNTTLVAFFLETLGNKSLGQGVLEFFMADFLALRIPVVENRDLETAFKQLKDRPVLPVIEEYGMRTSSKDGRVLIHPCADRKGIDDIVFDELRLTRGERDAIYEAVISMVQTRLAKAESLKPTQRRKRIEAASKTLGIWAGVPAEADVEDQE